MPTKIQLAKAQAREKQQERARVHSQKIRNKAKMPKKRPRKASPESYVSTSPKKPKTKQPSPVLADTPLTMETKVDKQQVSADQPFKVTLSHEPTIFASGNMGYKAYLRQASSVDGKEVMIQMNSNIIVLESAITAEWFMENSRPLKISIDAQPKAFETGHHGWHCRSTLNTALKGNKVTMNLNFNATIIDGNSLHPAPAPQPVAQAKKGDDGWGMEAPPAPTTTPMPQLKATSVMAADTWSPEPSEPLREEAADQPTPVSAPITKNLNFSPPIAYDDGEDGDGSLPLPPVAMPVAISHPPSFTNPTSSRPSAPVQATHTDTKPKGSSVCQMCSNGFFGICKLLCSLCSICFVVVMLLLLLYGPERTLELGRAAEKLIPDNVVLPDAPLSLLLKTLGINGDAADGTSRPEL